MSKTQRNKDFIYDLFTRLSDQHVEYIFRGNFDVGITDAILSLAEINLNSQEASNTIRKKVFYILVEGLQNITRHQEKDEKLDSFNKGFFVFQRFGEMFVITTGNLVRNETAEKLENKLQEINKLSKKELREYYQLILNNETFSEKGGAGLGLIEIARKSGNKLNYDFQKISDEYSYFYMQTVISKEPTDKSFGSLKKIEEIHQIFIKHDLTFNVTGIFNHEKLIYIISLLESNISKHVVFKNKVFGTLIEIMQNVVKHADEVYLNDVKGKHAVFLISNSGDRISLMGGNFIKKNKIEEVKSKFDYINSLSIKELSKKHFQTLFEYKNKKNGLSGLGLIDIRIKSKNKIDYTITELNNENAFLSMKIDLHKTRSKLEKLVIKETDSTPRVVLDREDGTFEICGQCYPEYPSEFFKPIIDWLKKYKQNPRLFNLFKIKFTYINTPSQKSVIDIFNIFEEISEKSTFIVKWHYAGDEQDNLSEMLVNLYPSITFEFVANSDMKCD